MKKTSLNIFASLFILVSFVWLTPMPAFAASYCDGFSGSVNLSGSGTTFSDVLKFGTCMLEKSVLPLLIAVALAIFVWGMTNFMRAQTTEDKQKGREFMIWGIVAIFLIFSVWGIINLFGSSLGVTNVIPQLPIAS